MILTLINGTHIYTHQRTHTQTNKIKMKIKNDILTIKKHRKSAHEKSH